MIALLLVLALVAADSPSTPSDSDAARGSNSGPSCAPARVEGPTTAFQLALQKASDAGFAQSSGTAPGYHAPAGDTWVGILGAKDKAMPSAIWSSTLSGPERGSGDDVVRPEIVVEEWIYADDKAAKAAASALDASAQTRDFALPLSYWQDGASLLLLRARNDSFKPELVKLEAAIKAKPKK